MSRYKLFSKDDFTVFVGWDNPLQTFFFQKYKYYDKKNEKIIKDMGTNFNKIPNIFEFDRILGLYSCYLDTFTYDNLIRDFNNRTESTVLQKRINTMFGQVKNE